MKRAAVIRQNNGMDKREALVVAHQIDVLIRKMYLASVSFYYTKQDGSIRHAVGTLTGYEHCFHRPYTPRPENTFVVYYDLEAKGWRTFHAENFLRAECPLINGLSPSGKAQGFDPCITLVRIQLAQLGWLIELPIIS